MHRESGRRQPLGGDAVRNAPAHYQEMTMHRLTIGVTLVVLSCVALTLGPDAAAQGRGGRGGGGGAGAAAQAPPEPTVFMGCVTGGNLQPVEQPFVLEPSEPFVIVDVVTRTNTTAFAPTDYRVTGINMTPWLGMRVRVEGTLVAPRPGASGAGALPEIRAARVSSIWGTCPSPAAWTPLPAR